MAACFVAIEIPWKRMLRRTAACFDEQEKNEAAVYPAKLEGRIVLPGETGAD